MARNEGFGDGPILEAEVALRGTATVDKDLPVDSRAEASEAVLIPVASDSENVLICFNPLNWSQAPAFGDKSSLVVRSASLCVVMAGPDNPPVLVPLSCSLKSAVAGVPPMFQLLGLDGGPMERLS